MTKKRFRGIALALALALEELAAGLGHETVPAGVLGNAVEVATQVLEEVFANTAFDHGKFKSAVLDEFGGGLWKGGDNEQWTHASPRRGRSEQGATTGDVVPENYTKEGSMAKVTIQKDEYQVRLTVIAGAFAELLNALDRVDDTLYAMAEVERLDPSFRINAVVPTGGDEPPLTAGGGKRSASGAPPWGGDQPEGAPPTWGAGADEPVTWGGE